MTRYVSTEKYINFFNSEYCWNSYAMFSREDIKINLF